MVVTKQSKEIYKLNGQQEEKMETKSWFKKHWILTTVGVIIFVMFLLAMIGSGTGKPTSQTSVASAAESNQTLENEKTSGYTVEDCDTVCNDVYDLQSQADICSNNCDYTYGKPSESLDKYVNNLKNRKKG
jgi:hypothetical protein